MAGNQDTPQTLFVSPPFDALRHEEAGRISSLARKLRNLEEAKTA